MNSGMLTVAENSNPWTGFTQFTILNEKPPDWCTWSGRRLTQTQSNTEARSLVKYVKSFISEEPKPDNALELRVFIFQSLKWNSQKCA